MSSNSTYTEPATIASACPPGRPELGNRGTPTSSLAFAPIASRLLEALALADSQNAISESLAANITRLQDHFVEKLYLLLQQHHIDLSTKITLRLYSSAPLVALGEHPEKDRINACLACNPELGSIFGEIASQSAALQHLDSLYQLTSQSLQGQNLPDVVKPYQVSLKGEMNHFYFRPEAPEKLAQ